ncbi:glycosyltransferase family 2 protein [Exiguobacterium sp. s194]|uniref:glycosyltransferase family 2 protein n=1 Tax=Exiguobacterium sp. s194 TaxID=2751230 RepID=UPI001BEB003B|nr:glycosyltransferase family 2 protein [Exiguobacterium sp. s194]
MQDIAVVILTFNEEKNIEKCIKSAKLISNEIYVVDSFSTDRTIEIAQKLNVNIFFNEFINHSEQLLFAIEKLPIKSTWIMRLDADEEIPRQASKEIINLCKDNIESEINGIVVRFQVNFLGKSLRYGGIYPLKGLRIFKKGKATVEKIEMDEHLYLIEGKSIEMKSDIIHNDFKSLTDWIAKHNVYSNKEVNYYFSEKKIEPNLLITQKIKKNLKNKIYYNLPFGIRPLSYFLYRYIIRLGFLDGKEGFMHAILQAFWYRFLVDCKIHERKKEKEVI